MNSSLTAGQLSFLALANEYCHAVEAAADTEPMDFVDSMLHLLPRLYITATDLPDSVYQSDEAYVPRSITEEYYDAARRGMETALGENDSYLEVFEEDMKYSETPIAASVAEGLADIFQALYDLTEAAKDATNYNLELLLQAAKEDFTSYWSAILCNVMRPLNAIKVANAF